MDSISLAALERLDGFVWLADAETLHLKYLSPRAPSALGCGAAASVPDLLVGMPREEATRLLEAVREVAARGGDRVCVFRTAAADGRGRALRTELHAVESAERSRDVLAYTSEVEPHPSERFGREKQLVDALVHGGPIALLAIDRDGRVLYGRGRPSTRIARFESTEEGANAFALYGDLPWMTNVMRRALGGEAGSTQGPIDGVTWEIYFTPLLDDDREVRGAVFLGIDAERRVRAEEAFFRVFHASPLPLSLTRLEDGTFLEVNQEFVHTFGYEREEVIGRSTIDLRIWNDPEDRVRAVAQLREQGHVRGFEASGRTKSGALIETATFMERIELGGRPCIVAQFVDMTERKRAEERLQRLYDQLRELDEKKARFTANASHELRTPLSLVLGLAERMLADAALSQGHRASAEAIARNARLLLKHVNDLLDASRLESGRTPIAYAEVDLARLVATTMTSFELVAGQRGISVDARIPPSLEAEVDPELVARIVTNLLSNALKFTPSGGRVRCSLTADDERAILEVADSGPGVPADMREKVFERYVQVDRGLGRRFAGTGLGLPIARELAALHRGRIELGEAPEGGALFRVELPRRAPAGVHVGTAAALPVVDVRAEGLDGHRVLEAAPAEPTPANAPSVLVVEDNPELSRFIADSLASSFAVSRASDGVDALGALERARPDAIVTDLMMPGMSGEELVHAVRERHELDEVPILVLTARAEDDLRTRLLTSGAQDYVLKPFARAELVARIGNWVAMKRARAVLQRELASRTSDLEQLARELTARSRELAATADSLNLAREQAERASRMKSDFLAMVSHELRTPLTTIQLQVQMLERAASTLPMEERAVLARWKTASARLLALVESLIEYANAQAGRLVVRAQPFDLALVASEVADELRPDVSRKGVEIGVVAGRLRPLVSDRRIVRTVLTNLLSNAIKFTERGFVRVEIEADPRVHVIHVVDSGIGIPDAEQEAVFEPFHHLEPVRRKHAPGFGLGLALVRELVEALGGTIDVASHVGAGSTFTVRLPTAKARDAETSAEVHAE